MIYDRDNPIDIPSDLNGISAATYSAKSESGLQEACKKLEKAIADSTRSTRDLVGCWYSSYQNRTKLPSASGFRTWSKFRLERATS